jgi:hypothetical protein
MTATDPMTPAPRPFSIRLPPPLWIGLSAVVLLIVAAGLGLGVPILRQQLALQEIQNLGGLREVRYAGPRWLQQSLGYERTHFLDVVTVVRLGGTEANDSDIRFLSGLGTVEHVVLFNTRVTDAALPRLRTAGRLKRLYLHGTHVTDAGIESLTTMPHLQVLDLSKTEITDAGLAHLREIKTLERLYIEETRVTDAGVADLQRLLPRLTIKR